MFFFFNIQLAYRPSHQLVLSINSAVTPFTWSLASNSSLMLPFIVSLSLPLLYELASSSSTAFHS